MAEVGELVPGLVAALNCYKYGYMPFRQLAESSRVIYETDITQFLLFVQGLGVEEPGKVERRHVKAFLAYLEGKGLEDVTQRRKLIVIQTFFAWLKTEGVIEADPARSIALPPREESEPRLLLKAEYERLLSVVDKPRDKAIIQLFLQTGISQGELQRLNLVDVWLPEPVIDESLGSVSILSKRGKERLLALNDRVCQALANWLAVRPSVTTSALFLSNRGRRISTRQIRRMVSNYLKQAHITGASVQTLRYTFAAHHLARGTKLETIKEHLGLALPESAEIYMALVGKLQAHQLQVHAL